VLTKEEARAVVATFSIKDWKNYYSQTAEEGKSNICAISVVLKDREEDQEEVALEGQEGEDPEEVALEGQEEEEKVPGKKKLFEPTPNEMRSLAKADANALVMVAVARIDAAESTISWDCQPWVFAEMFELVRKTLLDCTHPITAGAASAAQMLKNIMMIVSGHSEEATNALKEAIKDVRAALVMLCCTIQENPKSYHEFKVLTEQAFNTELNKNAHAQLGQAYRKLADSKQFARLREWGFQSNSHKAASQHGGPRPRREKKKTGEASASAGPASDFASCPAALTDPAFVMVEPKHNTGFNGQAHMIPALYGGQNNGFQPPASRQQLDMVGHSLPEQGHPQDAVQGCHTWYINTSLWAAAPATPAAQAVFGLSVPTMDSTNATDSQGSMSYHMHHAHFANGYPDHSFNGYNRSMAHNPWDQNGMTQEDPSALQHP